MVRLHRPSKHTQGRKVRQGMSLDSTVEWSDTNSRAAHAFRKGSAPLTIGVGGLLAGTLDLLQASILFGWKIPLVIAAGLLGPSVLKTGGAGTFILGVVLHYFIA